MDSVTGTPIKSFLTPVLAVAGAFGTPSKEARLRHAVLLELLQEVPVISTARLIATEDESVVSFQQLELVLQQQESSREEQQQQQQLQHAQQHPQQATGPAVGECDVCRAAAAAAAAATPREALSVSVEAVVAITAPEAVCLPQAAIVELPVVQRCDTAVQCDDGVVVDPATLAQVRPTRNVSHDRAAWVVCFQQ